MAVKVSYGSEVLVVLVVVDKGTYTYKEKGFKYSVCKEVE